MQEYLHVPCIYYTATKSNCQSYVIIRYYCFLPISCPCISLLLHSIPLYLSLLSLSAIHPTTTSPIKKRWRNNLQVLLLCYLLYLLPRGKSPHIRIAIGSDGSDGSIASSSSRPNVSDSHDELCGIMANTVKYLRMQLTYIYIYIYIMFYTLL